MVLRQPKVRRAWLIASSILGIAALAFGIAAIAAPRSAAMIYGLDPPRDDAWVMAAGVRDIGLGFALIAAVGMRSDHGIVAMLLGLVVVGLGDAMLVWSITGAPVAAHLLHIGGCGLSLALAVIGIRFLASEGGA